jgi:centromere protein C
MPVTPVSVLHMKGSTIKKGETKRVNWSTPNGTAGVPIGNTEFKVVPVSEFKAHYAAGGEPRAPNGDLLHRSSRARFKPLEFWKNEKLVFEANYEEGWEKIDCDMPVVAGVQLAKPTPRKQRVVKKRESREDGKAVDNDIEGLCSQKPFDTTKVSKKFKINRGEFGKVWSEILEDATEFKVVSRLDNRPFVKLPLSCTHGKKESKEVGFASQAFNVPTDEDDLFPGHISGSIILPQRGIKDAEGVGLWTQVFAVGKCQPNSVEFALADPSFHEGEFDPTTAQSYFLSQGDMFQIPAGNLYRIENHSRTDEARLFWTIIKCTNKAEEEGDE